MFCEVIFFVIFTKMKFSENLITGTGISALKSVKLFKGAIPTEYRGRLSSVLDIRMKEGNMEEFHGEGSIGLISSKLSLQGPIIKGKTSLIILQIKNDTFGCIRATY